MNVVAASSGKLGAVTTMYVIMFLSMYRCHAKPNDSDFDLAPARALFYRQIRVIE